MTSKLLLGALLSSALLRTGESVIGLKVEVIAGTSHSNCDSLSGDDAVWGAKVEEQSSFTVFHGEDYDCPPVSPKEDGPQLLFEEARECDNQRESIRVCLLAGDDDRFGCDSVKESDMGCKVSGCQTIQIGTCFDRSCVAEFTKSFDVFGDDTRTEGATFRVSRIGGCPTGSPTSSPTKGPTKSPFVRVPTVSPSKSPTRTFPCAGTFESCGGGPSYVGPNCCIANHECVEVAEEDFRCSIITEPPEEEAEESSVMIYVAGAGAVLLLALFVGITIFFSYKSRKERLNNTHQKTKTDTDILHYTRSIDLNSPNEGVLEHANAKAGMVPKRIELQGEGSESALGGRFSGPPSPEKGWVRVESDRLSF